MKHRLKAYYLFSKTSMPSDLGNGITSTLKDLKHIKDKEEYLNQAYELITTKFEGGRFKTFSRLFDLLSTNAEDLWNRTGFMHCTNQNYLLALILIKSGRFSSDDVVLKWTTIWYWSPHQYLQVRINSKLYINVDCWGRYYGIPYGSYANGFNITMRRSFVE